MTNQNIYSEADTYNGTFCSEDCRTKNESQDYHSDDDVSAIIDSDSDILETVEKANIVEFLNDNRSTLAGFKEELSTYNFRRESAERNFDLLTRPNKRVGLVKSTIFSIVKKTEAPFCTFSTDAIC